MYCFNFALYGLFNQGNFIISKPSARKRSSLSANRLVLLNHWTSRLRLSILFIAFVLLAFKVFTEFVYTITIITIGIDSLLLIYRAARKQLIA
jgi:hypothetical protein